MRAFNIAATGMMAQQLNVEVISNNIANITTTGFKRQRAEFQDLLYQPQKRVGSNTSESGTLVPTGVELGLGVKAGAVYRIHEQGNVIQTQNVLDLAVQGKGYFRIELPDGEFAYTRAGAFQLSPNGEIVNTDGFRVTPGLTIPPEAEDISVSKAGVVEAKIPGQIDPQVIGTLDIVTFINDAGLKAIGENLFKESPASGAALVGIPGQQGVGTIMQGFVETSNVNAVTEITNLIVAQRSYEMNSKVITASDQMLQALNQAA
ncbi:MAG: flagellar basal-body rod protein FlgG [Alphaproteobacteria bacterium]|nr:flagellar basal-body rod protein FlgG [Alphaproteobacteria bacterium]